MIKQHHYTKSHIFSPQKHYESYMQSLITHLVIYRVPNNKSVEFTIQINKEVTYILPFWPK